MTRSRRSTAAVAGAALAALALPAVAPAQQVQYPPPSSQKVQAAPKGPSKTRWVCAKKGKKRKGCLRTIQAAVNKARAGDTVRIPNGTYREAVKVNGAGKRYLRIVGNRRNPARVVVDGARLPISKRTNGFAVNGADRVTIAGIQAQNFNGNGFFVVNVNGYTLTRLKAFKTGVYGIYAFNSIGGSMTNSEAAWHNDAGFYIGQTPLQVKPKRSIVRNVSSYGNVIGFSGTNMRYVTITKSRWFNNGLGIVPNALDSEKDPPEEDNVITDNDVFWNNFNYYAGAPFKKASTSTGGVPYPVGVGVLLFGGRRNVVENNRIYGNYLVGVGALQQLLLEQKDAQDLVGNVIRGNQLGLNGTDKNGRDLFYDGNGRDNCVSGNTGVEVTVPADGSTFAPCGTSGFSGPNAFSAAAQAEALSWVADATHEAAWIRHPHAARPGYTPLEHFEKGKTPMRQPSR
jgi:hypothetical protein